MFFVLVPDLAPDNPPAFLSYICYSDLNLQAFTWWWLLVVGGGSGVLGFDLGSLENEHADVIVIQSYISSRLLFAHHSELPF